MAVITMSATEVAPEMFVCFFSKKIGLNGGGEDDGVETTEGV